MELGELGSSAAQDRNAIIRVVQQALANISKHADATNVYVRLSKTGNGLKLSIADDGK